MSMMQHQHFFSSFSELADTKQVLEWLVLRANFLGSIFPSRRMQESNQCQLGEKRQRYLCIMSSPKNTSS